MALDTPWQDGTRRTVEILGGEEQKFNRTVEDRLTLTFTLEEWNNLFNVKDGYCACDANWSTYNNKQPIQIHFIKRDAQRYPPA